MPFDCRNNAPIVSEKTLQFRRLLQSNELEFLLEAHNGISAKIGEEAGFKGLWAGGLCMSAQYGVRDNNEASWTQVLEMLEFMADATTVPILMDGDTGFGNFNNVRRLVRKLEQRGIAAVCIEDKLYPKTNSFINGDKQQLAEIDEFCSRIKAGKDAQSDDDFAIITRIEAFVAGWGLGEALRRAEAYLAAGSDGILIHSALSTPTEVLAFKREWADRSPVLIVPTKYYATPTDVFRDAAFSIAIFANHLLRAALTAMQGCAATLAREQSLLSIENAIAPVKEIFRLQGAPELEAAEERYLPHKNKESRAIVLAASRGSALGELTATRPKAMVEVAGQPILAHIVDTYNSAGIRNITVVRGYRPDSIRLPALKFVDNPAYADSGELQSLARALEADRSDSHNLYISFGDVLFRRYMLDIMAEPEDEFVMVVDTDWRSSANLGRPTDFVSCTQPHSRRDYYHKVYLEEAGESLPEARTHGEWTGLLRVSKAGLPVLRERLAELAALPENQHAKLYDLLNALVSAGHRPRVVYTTGHWLDIDSLDDVLAASAFT